MADEATIYGTMEVRNVEGWTITVDRPRTPLFGMTYEVKLHRPDGTYVVMSRDESRVSCIEDMDAAAFAIAAVLDPEHNGPWQPRDESGRA